MGQAEPGQPRRVEQEWHFLHGKEAKDEEDEEDEDVPDYDVSQPPDPYFLFWHSVHRLDDDQLIDLGDHESVSDLIDFMQEATYGGLDHRRRNPGGTYPGRPFETVTELGARYLAFLSD